MCACVCQRVGGRLPLLHEGGEVLVVLGLDEGQAAVPRWLGLGLGLVVGSGLEVGLGLVVGLVVRVRVSG